MKNKSINIDVEIFYKLISAVLVNDDIDDDYVESPTFDFEDFENNPKVDDEPITEPLPNEGFKRNKRSNKRFNNNKKFHKKSRSPRKYELEKRQLQNFKDELEQEELEAKRNEEENKIEEKEKDKNNVKKPFETGKNKSGFSIFRDD